LNLIGNEFIDDSGYQAFFIRLGATAAALTPEAIQTKPGNKAQRWAMMMQLAAGEIR
jgi:hypothetical protein